MIDIHNVSQWPPRLPDLVGNISLSDESRRLVAEGQVYEVGYKTGVLLMRMAGGRSENYPLASSMATGIKDREPAFQGEGFNNFRSFLQGFRAGSERVRELHQRSRIM